MSPLRPEVVDVTTPRSSETDSDADETSRKERRDRYRQLLSTIAHNTTERQSPGIRPATVRLHLVCHGRWSVDGVESSIRAARENDDLVRWRDQEGNVRLTLRVEPDLKRLAEHVAEVLQDPTQLSRVNRALVNVMDDPTDLGRTSPASTTYDE